MNRLLTICCGMALGTAVFADGFVLTDFSQVKVDPSVFSGGAFEVSLEPDRITAFCKGCTDIVGVDIQMGRSTDGTEGRVRSGETTIAKMEEICQSRDPSCRLSGLDVGPATGWVTTYGTNSTVILFRDGDLLTMRAISSDLAVSKANAQVAIDVIAPQIVGLK